MTKNEAKDTNKKLTEEELQEKYVEFKTLQEQLEQIGQQAEMLNQHNAELEISVRALEELNNTKVGAEILAPIADGIFFRGKLENNEKLVINVGANTTVEKTIPEVVKLLQEQKKETTLQVVKAEAIIQELQQQAQKIYQEVEENV